jgi:hypothetical protein
MVRHIPTLFIFHANLIIVAFIDDDPPIASGSGTQQHRSWNDLQNDEDLEDFFAGIYERSRSRRMRPTVEDTTDPHESIRALPGAEEFPLWRIGCMVRTFITQRTEENM